MGLGLNLKLKFKRLIPLIFLPLCLGASNVKYKTSFGQCPSRTAGSLALGLISEFEKTGSLKEVKKLIVKDKLDEKHYLSDYKIDYNPIDGQLKFDFDCPEPLMKVQIYKETGSESYEALLVSNGRLYDPTYEVLLRSENKLHRSLPYLAIPVGEMDEDLQFEIADLINQMNPEFRAKLSEVILADTKELTVILSVKNRPSSVFLGPGDWKEKIEKLDKLVSYMESKNKIPSVINLTNVKKVVVKFDD